MPYVKCDTWPLVTENDDGIRPAGKPDECFYCHRKVGKPHKHDCVCVTSLVLWNVLVNEVKRGTYKRHMVYGYELGDWEFKLNEGTWCSDNCLDEVEWEGGIVPAEITEFNFEEGCTCSLLGFEFVAVLDIGPFVWEREEGE